LHQRIFTMLALIIPGLLFIGLVFRPQVPPVADIDPALRDYGGFPTAGEWHPQIVSAEILEFEVQARSNASTDTGTLLIRPKTHILKPDLLVYWASSPPASDTLGKDAVLVGRLSGTSRRQLALPTAASGGNGTILIYSLAHHEVITRFPLGAAMDNTKPGE
jgi:hypothetical protein